MAQQQEKKTESAKRIAAYRHRLASEALADNTIRAYAASLDRWDAWRRSRRRPVSDKSVADYITDLVIKGTSPSTIKVLNAALDHRAMRSGRKSPVGRLTKKAYSALTRTSPPSTQLTGIDWVTCEKAVAEIDTGNPIGQRNIAIISLMSWCLLRVSEVRALNISDVDFIDSGAHIKIRRSKTDQVGAGAVFWVDKICAARIAAWLDVKPPHDALFTSQSRAYKPARLSDTAIRNIIKTSFGKFYDTDRISGHSLRIGSAQQLLELGATEAQIGQAGRWITSGMPRHYTALINANKSAVALFRGGG